MISLTLCSLLRISVWCFQREGDTQYRKRATFKLVSAKQQGKSHRDNSLAHEKTKLFLTLIYLSGNAPNDH